ncbi:uncharacterized protein MONBRDRAFT_37751 [Monosiga brevicollis MX1]|uniref:MPN domain-containing protein n=1 Tax=Monosiga brevicollis TaxID=81824 RepID=A9V3T8_MONBE|nr:uncharacterized protein MONBRDRAFT_37751 [Monosiga brevicollis MX1]EDQ87865.1 predicted protein [Monosiga brevicollis MX1]|eukprot:XP_001747398.1 hypothetical protein [Monosiga brevicollis MX1]
MASLDIVTKKPVSGETTVTVHPLVLLSVVDHYNRTSKGTKHRSVGVLLGSWKSPTNLDIANSFALPFEEDLKSPDVWYMDHDYLRNMFGMFRRVNAKERVVGWYHTGPKLRANDIQISEMLQKFVEHPILCVIDVRPEVSGLPIKAYVAVEEIHDDGTPTTKGFEHVGSEVGAEEVEEVGVEHLLRDITDLGFSGSLSHRLQQQLDSLKGLSGHLQQVHEYLQMVAEQKLPINHNIMYLIQEIFNNLPNVSGKDLATSVSNTTSDQMLVVYLASMIRATIALHNLINNKLENLEHEKEGPTGTKKKPAAEESSEDNKESGKDKAKEKAGKKPAQ